MQKDKKPPFSPPSRTLGYSPRDGPFLLKVHQKEEKFSSGQHKSNRETGVGRGSLAALNLTFLIKLSLIRL